MKDNKHSINRIKNAYKNYQREWKFPFHQSIELFGFYCSCDLHRKRFIRFLARLPGERRRAIMRIGRAALKRGTLVQASAFITSRFHTPEPDLRKIPFVSDTKQKHSIENLTKAVKSLRDCMSYSQIINLITKAYYDF